jgi:histidinol-phosphate/aromatic aminotransferase/cobyric acid decarboxylase-like protein
MSSRARNATAATRPTNGKPAVLRLDRLLHPNGTCQLAVDSPSILGQPDAQHVADSLRSRISKTYRVPEPMICLHGGREEVMSRVLSRAAGPLILFPPSSVSSALRVRSAFGSTVVHSRGVGRDGSIDPVTAADLPRDGVAVIASPSDPLGSLLNAADAVRLARACRFVVIDERFAELAGFSLLPFAVEFDNIVIVRSFSMWEDVLDLPGGWLAASAEARDALGFEADIAEPEAMAAALSTLDDRHGHHTLLALLREERSRLFRLLRKFSYLEPIPSWGPFVSARVEIVSREALLAALETKGIFVHAPDEPGLERFIRISIGDRVAMERLRSALLEVAPALIG